MLRTACGAPARAILRQSVRRFSTAAQAELPQAVGTAGRYSSALYKAATKQGCLDIVSKDVEKMQQMRESNTKLDEFLRNPSLTRSSKVEAIGEIMSKGGFSKTFTQFMLVIAENGRTSESSRILQSFQDTIATLKGEAVVKVTSAMPMTEWELALLKKNVKKRFFQENPEADLTVETVVDHNLLGGLTIQVGDRFMDLSTRTELRKLQEVIQETVA